MATLTSETIEFKATGGDSLVQQYEKLQAESLKLKVQTGQLSQQLKDGSFLKQANDIQRAGAELKKYREEQRKLWDDGRRQILQQRYGQTMGGLAFNAQRYGKPAMEMARAIGSSTLGVAASFGVPLGIGALANRGFAGTAPAQQFQNEIDRLSRSIATDLIPVINKLTSGLKSVNDSQDKMKRGGGEISDAAKGYVVPGALAALGTLGAASWLTGGSLSGGLRTMGGSLMRGAGSLGGGLLGRGGLAALGYGGFDATGLAGGAAGGTSLGAIGIAAAPLLAAGGIFNMRFQSGTREKRAADLAAGAGLRDSEKESVNDLIEAGKKIKSDTERRDFFRKASADAARQERELVDRQNKKAPLGILEPFQAIGVAMFGGSERIAAAKYGARSEFAARLARGEGLEGKMTPDMQFVQGAGGKSSITDIAEELSQGLGQVSVKTPGGGGTGGNAMERTAKACEDILYWLNNRITS